MEHRIDASDSSRLPTPTGRDHKGRNQRDDATCLPGAVSLLPTPTGDDANNVTRESGDFLSLARTLHGVHTSPPSDGGSTSSDDPPHGQLMIGDA